MRLSTPNNSNVTEVGTSSDVVEIAPPAQDVTTAEPKFTAARVAEDYPPRLQEIGREITERLEEAYEQKKLADDHVIAVKKLIAEAKELCDVGGFDAFREKLFQNLGKSRAYEMLAIATNKKTIEETRAGTRERVAKHRANKAEATFSVTVTDEPLEPREAPIECGTLETASNPPEQALEPVKLRRGRAPAVDEALRDFSARVQDLDRRTDKKPARRFAGTTVPADKLARLGKLLTDLANLKKNDAAKPVAALPGNGTVIPASRNSIGDINESSQASNA